MIQESMQLGPRSVALKFAARVAVLWRDARVGVYKYLFRLEMFGAPSLVLLNTSYEMCKGTATGNHSNVLGISRMNLQTEIPWPIFSCILNRFELPNETRVCSTSAPLPWRTIVSVSTRNSSFEGDAQVTTRATVGIPRGR